MTRKSWLFKGKHFSTTKSLCFFPPQEYLIWPNYSQENILVMNSSILSMSSGAGTINIDP